VRGALAAALLVGVLFVFVYPTRSFLDQRNQLHKARAQLDVLQQQSEKLANQEKRLRSDAEIARIARQLYGLVEPGEQPFVILPAPTTSTTPPAATTAPPTAAKPAP
jgi:cell division protein FtsB